MNFSLPATFPASIMNLSDLYDFDDEDDYLPSFIDETDSWQSLAEASAVLTLCFITTATSLFVITSLTVGNLEVLDFYLLSQCTADLLTSVAVVPLALAAKSGFLTGGGHPACAVSGYLHVSLCAVRMYTFMWTAVDRYLAIRKPHRYDGIQTRTRCQCCLLFSWVTATCLCCPPLLGDFRGHFYHEGFLCLLDISSMLPYSITLGCLVFIPSVLTILYTYGYIFTTSESPESIKEDDSGRSSYHVVTFLVTVEFIVLWIPWGTVNILEHLSGKQLVGAASRFWLLYLGESHIVWNPLTLLVLCRRCRDGFTSFCTKTPSDVPV